MDLIFTVYAIAQVFLVFALHRFMNVFFEKRRTSFFVYALSYLLYLTGTVSVFFALKIPLANLFCNILTIFIITLNFESPLKRKIAAVCFIYSFMFITDIFLASLSGVLFVSPVNETENSAVFGYIALGLLIYLESIFAQNLKNIRKNSPVSALYWFSSFAIPLCSIYIAIPILGNRNTSHTVLASSIAVVFLINVLTFYLHDSLSAAYADKLKSELYEKEREYYYSQCELMRESEEDLNSFKHDIKNNLSVLSSFVRQNQCEEAAEYLHRLIGEVSDSACYSNTGNTAFDSIINYKLRNVKENKVDLQVSIIVPSDLKIDVSDTVAILGNLLDNAVDAVIKTESGRIYLNVRYSKGRIFIYIENTYDGRMNCKNGDILSTKSGRRHGYGLKNIRKTLEKYNGCMDIEYTDTVFSVDILMYVNPVRQSTN